MKRIVWTYGLILGAILAGIIFYTVNLIYNNPNFKGNDVVGYAGMVIVFSLTFFGIRNYRNRQLNGLISFGKAFKTGALIALVGSTIYVVVWMFYYHLFVPDFLDKYIAIVLNDASRSGATSEEMATRTAEMAQFKEMYKNPFFAILITYSEVLPVGLMVALVSALILKRKPDPIIA